MKRTIANLSLSVSVALLLAFTNPVKKDVFTVDAQRSSIDWIGRKVTGQHTGKINISGGELIWSGNVLKGGSFNIDMPSITSDNAKLTGHLKTEDFFSVEKNPVSKFEITNVSPSGANQVNVTGNLTIKGITESLSFPASVKKQGNTVVAVAKGVKVNRVKYDIRYGSKSFFNDIGDKAIDDEFELAINLVAKK